MDGGADGQRQFWQGRWNIVCLVCRQLLLVRSEREARGSDRIRSDIRSQTIDSRPQISDSSFQGGDFKSRRWIRELMGKLMGMDVQEGRLHAQPV